MCISINNKQLVAELNVELESVNNIQTETDKLIKKLNKEVKKVHDLYHINEIQKQQNNNTNEMQNIKNLLRSSHEKLSEAHTMKEYFEKEKKYLQKKIDILNDIAQKISIGKLNEDIDTIEQNIRFLEKEIQLINKNKIFNPKNIS